MSLPPAPILPLPRRSIQTLPHLLCSLFALLGVLCIPVTRHFTGEMGCLTQQGRETGGGHDWATGLVPHYIECTPAIYGHALTATQQSLSTALTLCQRA